MNSNTNYCRVFGHGEPEWEESCPFYENSHLSEWMDMVVNRMFMTDGFNYKNSIPFYGIEM